MKKHILFAGFSLGIIASGTAQTAFGVEKSDTTLYGLATVYTFYGDIDLFNNQDSPFLMHWEVLEVNIPSGWTTSNCDPTMCHNVGVTTASFNLPVLPSYLNTHFYPANVPGTGNIKVKLWVDSDPLDYAELTYYGVAGVTSVNTMMPSDVAVFPVPAKDVLNIGFPQVNETVQVKLVDLSGRTVMQREYAGGGFIQFNIATLSPGMYMAQVVKGTETLVTKRFVKE